MTDEYMTLASALATGLPFKHKYWMAYTDPRDQKELCWSIPEKAFFEPVWQVQRPNPKIKLWKNGTEPEHFYFAYGPVDSDDDKEVTGEELQQIREILKDEK